VLIAVAFRKGVLDTKYPELQIHMADLPLLFILYNGDFLVISILLSPIDQTQT